MEKVFWERYMTVLNKSTRNVLLDKDHFNRIIFSQLRLFLSPSLLHHCFLQLPLSFNSISLLVSDLVILTASKAFLSVYLGILYVFLRVTIFVPFSMLIFNLSLFIWLYQFHGSAFFFSFHWNSPDLVLVSSKTYDVLHNGKTYHVLF